jgi:hypothetical protein
MVSQPTELEPATASHAPGSPADRDAAAGSTPGPDGPASFSPEQLQALAVARQRAGRISRAALVSALSGWTMAFFAAITFLSGLFSWPALLIGAALGVIAYAELRGSRGLRRFDLEAPRRLGYNQIALGVLLVAYGTWGLVHALVATSPYESYLAAGGQVAEMLEPIDRLNRAITVIVYLAVILVGMAAPAFGSVYYFTRRRHIVAYLDQTPDWIVETLRIAAG